MTYERNVEYNIIQIININIHVYKYIPTKTIIIYVLKKIEFNMVMLN